MSQLADIGTIRQCVRMVEKPKVWGRKQPENDRFIPDRSLSGNPAIFSEILGANQARWKGMEKTGALQRMRASSSSTLNVKYAIPGAGVCVFVTEVSASYR